mgnify:FL=1
MAKPVGMHQDPGKVYHYGISIVCYSVQNRNGSEFRSDEIKAVNDKYRRIPSSVVTTHLHIHFAILYERNSRTDRTPPLGFYNTNYTYNCIESVPERIGIFNISNRQTEP